MCPPPISSSYLENVVLNEEISFHYVKHLTARLYGVSFSSYGGHISENIMSRKWGGYGPRRSSVINAVVLLDSYKFYPYKISQLCAAYAIAGH